MNNSLKLILTLYLSISLTYGQEFMDKIENAKRIRNNLTKLFNGFRISLSGKLTFDGFVVGHPRIQAKRFKSISEDLKLIEDHYLDCLSRLTDNNYSEETIDECVGKEYGKVNNDIDYFKRKLYTKVEQHIRADFIDLCYNFAIDEIMLQSCDLFEKDTLDVLWLGLNIHKVADINRNKYMKNFGLLSERLFERLLLRFKPLYAEFSELLQEIRDHNISIVAAIKNSVDERSKLILIKAKESNGYTPLPKMLTHTIEVTQTLSQDPVENIHNMPSILMDGSTKLYADSYDGSGITSNYTPDNFEDLLNGPHVVIPIRKLEKRMEKLRQDLKAKKNKKKE